MGPSALKDGSIDVNIGQYISIGLETSKDGPIGVNTQIGPYKP